MNLTTADKKIGINIVSFLLILLLVVTVQGFGNQGQDTDRQNQKRWNFVFILADDLGWNQVGYQQPVDFYETPNIDRLAVEGMHFTAAYTNASICSPTRAGIMTGKHPARLHITDYIPGSPFPYARLTTPEMAERLPLEETTIPEMLKSKGYKAGHFGKWHLNKDKNYKPGRPGDPASQGFDDVLATVKPDPDADPDNDAHHTIEITERTLAFIEKNKDNPFFAYVSYHAIHRPLLEKADMIEKYDEKWAANLEETNSIMGAMIERMDIGIGQILETLEELGIADRTVVIFYSDNGGLENLQDQYPLRGGKTMVWEGGIRVPLIIKWPGITKPGKSDVPVTSTDFFPTIAEIAGIKYDKQNIDGTSLLPLLKQTGTLARSSLYWHYPHYHHQGYKPAGAIRDGDYKLIEWYEETMTGASQQIELYNIRKDIGETNNIVKMMPEKAREMRRELHEWRDSIEAQEMEVNPEYDPSRQKLRFKKSEINN